jgi:hypothetical protein
MTGTVRRELSGRLLIAGEHHLRPVLAGNCPTTPPPGRTAPRARCPRLTLTPGRRRPASLSTGSADSRPAGGRTHDYQVAA